MRLREAGRALSQSRRDCNNRTGARRNAGSARRRPLRAAVGKGRGRRCAREGRGQHGGGRGREGPGARQRRARSYHGGFSRGAADAGAGGRRGEAGPRGAAAMWDRGRPLHSWGPSWVGAGGPSCPGAEPPSRARGRGRAGDAAGAGRGATRRGVGTCPGVPRRPPRPPGIIPGRSQAMPEFPPVHRLRGAEEARGCPWPGCARGCRRLRARPAWTGSKGWCRSLASAPAVLGLPLPFR